MGLGTGKWPIPFSPSPSNASHAVFVRSSILCLDLFFAVVFIISYYKAEFARGLSEVILCFDWLPERVREAPLKARDFPRRSLKRGFFSWTKMYPLLTIVFVKDG